MTNTERMASIRSRPKHISHSGKNYPLKLRKQNVAAVLIANTHRNTHCDQPAFQVLGVYDTTEEAGKALFATDRQGAVIQLHRPFLIAEHNDLSDEDMQTRVDELIQVEKDCNERNEAIQKQRIKFARQNTAVNEYEAFEKRKLERFQAIEEEPEDAADTDEEPVEFPEMEEVSPEGRKNKDQIMPLEDDCIVVSVIGGTQPEPAIVVHGQFSSLERAELYVVNTLSTDDSVPHSYINIYQRGEWYFPNDEARRTDARDVVFLDEGLDTFMRGHVNSRDEVERIKGHIDKTDILAPEPNLNAPAPVVCPDGTGIEIIDTGELNARLEKKAIRHNDTDTNAEGLEEMRSMGILAEDNTVITGDAAEPQGGAAGDAGDGDSLKSLMHTLNAADE